jgi:hypothetical protein
VKGDVTLWCNFRLLMVMMRICFRLVKSCRFPEYRTLVISRELGMR